MRRENYIASFLMYLIAFGIFGAIFSLNIRTDLQWHVQYTVNMMTGVSRLTPNFLYYLVLFLVSFLNTDTGILFCSAVFILAFSVTAKFILSKQFIASILEDELGTLGQRDAIFLNRLTLIASGMLIFCYAIPFTYFLGGYYYLGNYPPNVWHNSTSIFLMPFALLLFMTSYKQLKTPTHRRIIAITCLSILNILIKPSFFFCFCMVYPLFLLMQYGFRKQFWLNLTPVMIGAVFVLIEYYLLFVDGSGDGISIDLFKMWSIYSINIPLSFLGSIFSPMLYIFLYWKEVRKELLFQYSISLFLIAVIIFSTLIESGDTRAHGNFGWQYIITNFMLYMVFVAFLCKQIGLNQKEYPSVKDLLKGMGWKNQVLLFTFSFQFLLGVYYLYQTFLTRKIMF